MLHIVGFILGLGLIALGGGRGFALATQGSKARRHAAQMERSRRHIVELERAMGMSLEEAPKPPSLPIRYSGHSLGRNVERAVAHWGGSTQ
jgi:hypothetical protein